MVRLVEVLRRVLVFRTIAATDVPALEAETQVNPLIACLQTLLAPVRRSRLRIRCEVEMLTFLAEFHKLLRRRQIPKYQLAVALYA